jgi:DNA polymerase III delta prime subunit
MYKLDCDIFETEIEETVEKKNNLPWIEKYRPNELSEIISHEHIVQTIKNFMKTKNMPHLLLYGPSGTGKTSTIVSCGKELYGQYYPFMVLELNTSDNRGIETVRQKIKGFVNAHNEYYIPEDKRKIFKLVILDEIDAMTHDAQAILRQIMEKNSSTTRFCLICNFINKINYALQSRCCKFRFRPLKSENIVSRLEYICEQEKLNFTPDSLNAIVQTCCGDMRKAINILQTTSLTYDDITKEKVYICSGYCNPEKIFEIYTQLIETSKSKNDFKKLFKNIKKNINSDKFSMCNLIYSIKNLIIFNNTNPPLTQKNISENEVESNFNDYYTINTDYNDEQKIFIIIELAKLETQIAIKNDDLKIMNLVSIFNLARNLK